MKKYFGLILSVFAFGCIESPILNHRSASDLRIIAASQAAQPAASVNCEISFPTQKLCASWEWIVAPLDSDTRGEARLKFWNTESGSHAGPYLSPQEQLSVEPWMSSMGHGTRPAPIVTQEMDSSGSAVPGVFLVKPVRFIMWGDWDIRIQLRSNGAVVSQAVVPYFVP